MKKILRASIMLLCVMWFWGCDDDKDNVVITLADNGKAVPVIVGDIFEIQLDGNPSTGYAWRQTAGNNEIVKQIEEPYFLHRGSAPGSGGIFVFKMEAVSVGYTTLKFEYVRPFSTETVTGGVFEVIIAVQNKISG